MTFGILVVMLSANTVSATTPQTPGGARSHQPADSASPPGLRDNSFTEIQVLPGVDSADAAWGDFDGDGDLDLVMAGWKQYGSMCKTYENQSGTMVLRDSLPAINNWGSSDFLDWGDYDGDGDLDLAMAGICSEFGRIARIYDNDGAGNLTYDASHGLIGLEHASIAWGDVDSDGDLDLLLKGYHISGTYYTVLYENAPLGTLGQAALLTGSPAGSLDWADWDGDGDFDLLTTGSTPANPRETIFYRNDGGTLVDTGNHGVVDLRYADAAWGDYDNDGDLDLVISGERSDVPGFDRLTEVYRNNGAGGMTDVNAGMAGLERSSCAWGDYDNDGDLDVAVSGDGGGSYSRIYENTGSDNFSLAFEWNGGQSVTWADVDQDADLDLLVMRAGGTVLYRNGGGPANTAPSAPAVLTSEPTPDGMRLTWSGANDTQTPGQGLYYCLRVGTTPGANDVVSGTYGSPLMGNAGQMTDVELLVPDGTYYWSVRAIDSGFMTSAWPAEEVASTITAIEGSFFAAATESGTALLRWTVADLVAVEGFSICRATKPDGPFTRVNEEIIPPSSPCSFEDATVWPETTFWYELRAHLVDGSEDVVGSLASVTTGGRLVATLRHPSPNPVAGSCTIQFDVPNHVGPATLAVYDAAGRRVKTLVHDSVSRGRHRLSWNSSDDRGRPVPSGVYFIRLVIDNRAYVRKLAVVR